MKESSRKLWAEIQERTFEAVVWCRDTYQHNLVIRATINSNLVLLALFLIDRLAGHPMGLRMMYILPIWLAAKWDGRISGYITVATTAIIMTMVDLEMQVIAPSQIPLNSVLRLAVLVGLMACLDHFESNLRKYVRMATRDALTGAYNRLGLDEYLPRAINKALGSGTYLTVAMIDCDKFKQINDEFGHEYGDEILKKLTRLLRRSASNSLLARNGGDEFVLVLPGKTPSEAQKILEQVKWKFRESTVIDNTCASFSYGLARLGFDGNTVEALMKSADRNMYINKAAQNLAIVETDQRVKQPA